MNSFQLATMRALLFTGALLGAITQTAFATDFAWVEDAAPLERGALKLSVGGAFYDSAPFPYAGLDGKLYEAPWVGLRYSASDNAQFYFDGAFRKFITVERVDKSAAGAAELQQPPILDQTRSATGDFSIYSKLRFPLFDNKLDFGLVTGFTMPNTNTSSGLGLDRGAIHGRLILGYSLRGIRLVANGGIAIIDNTADFGQTDFLTYGFGAVVTALAGFKLHSELYGIKSPSGGFSDGLLDSLNMALGASLITDKYAIDITAKGFFEEPSPSSAFFIRFSRTFHLGRR